VRPKLGWEALTPAESHVARLVAAGHRNSEIAAQLFVSKRTVEAHLWRIYAKLEATSRVEIARVAMAHGSGGVMPAGPRRAD
jgi:DNA-binding CsgD family transcriptional regulator